MIIDNDTQRDVMRVAHLMADAARPLILRYFRNPEIQTMNKPGHASGFDPVTEADRGAETVMRAILATERPDDGIIGEEHGNQSGSTGITWVLDPIDGTRGFISGTPTWGVLIAASTVEGPQFGIIDQPYIGERFVGGFDAAALDGPHGTLPFVTRQTTDLSQAIVMSTFPEVGTPQERAAFHAVADQAKLTRYGTDCYAYGLLALGQIDLVIEAGLQAYDIHAPIAVVQASGGVVTDWSGGPAHTSSRIIAASNPEIHAAALAVLQANCDD